MKEWSVREFGAVGDGHANDTLAVQAAIDACAQAGGGVVSLSAGKYLCSSIILKSHVHLRLDSGAVLCEHPDMSLYPEDLMEKVWQGNELRCIFLYAKGQEDIHIFGDGMVLGNGTEDFGSWWGITEHPPVRIAMLLFDQCRDIVFHGVRFCYSDFWTLHLRQCEDVVIDRVTIKNNFRRLNTDGIDPDACRNVFISNCHISVGDDAIVAKSSVDGMTENMVVSNCVLESPCTAIKLGTDSVAGFRDIHFTNCIIRNSAVGIGIYMKDGGTAERISFSNISIENWDIGHVKPVFPMFLDIEKRHMDSPIGIVRDIVFENIQAVSANSAVFQGMPERPIENLTFSNITLRVPFFRGFENRKKAVTGRRTTKDERDFLFVRKPAYAVFAYVNGLTVQNFRVFLDPSFGESCDRYAVWLRDVSEPYIKGVFRDPPLPQGDVFWEDRT